MRKVAMCRAKPYELIERTQEEAKKNSDQEETSEIIEDTSIIEDEEKIEDSETKIQEENENEIEEENEAEKRIDLQNDIIGAKYLQVEKSVYFMDYQIYSVEVPIKDHGKPEIVAAKNKEMKNLEFMKHMKKLRMKAKKL